jgi:hypothetical protein
MAGNGSPSDPVVVEASAQPKRYGGVRVLVAGGGGAGLETLLGLIELHGDESA